jgi:CheY-like chemotaxis protein
LALVVDDDDFSRDALSMLLRGQGLRVEARASGREGLAYLHRGPPPDLIVLDLVMPDMDGWEFRLAQMRDAELASIPVLVVSADQSAKAQALNADAYVPKPVDGRRLLASIRALLERKSRRDQSVAEAQMQQIRWLGYLAEELATPLKRSTSSMQVRLQMAIERLQACGHDAGDLQDVLRKAMSAVSHTELLLTRFSENCEPLDPVTGARASLLVIDDDATLREAQLNVLRDDYDVVGVASGPQAVELLRSCSFDLIICRLCMAEVSGLKLAQALARTHPEQAKRFLYVVDESSADASEADGLPVSTRGNVLQRPFSTEQLREAVRTRLENWH